MKNIFFAFTLLAVFFSCIRTAKNSSKPLAVRSDLYAECMDPHAPFDSVMAKKFGADQYGMKRYVMAFLKRGPNRNQDSLTAAQLQKAHLDNIIRLAEQGKLVLAGPFMDAGDVRGIYIFNVSSVEEAQQLTATDPAIQAGRLAMELHPWYGTAVLPIIPPMSKRLEKKSVAD